MLNKQYQNIKKQKWIDVVQREAGCINKQWCKISAIGYTAEREKTVKSVAKDTTKKMWCVWGFVFNPLRW